MTIPAHTVTAPFVPKRTVNVFCQRKWLEAGKLNRCSVPTEGGATYCKACSELLSIAPSGRRYKVMGGIA